jgi:acetyltransferase-like isoleucine patch superfamily enzyme
MNTRRLLYRIKRLLGTLTGPRMVYGYAGPRGVFLPRTRVSSSTVFFAEERLQVQDNVFIGHFSVLDASFGLTIEEGCQIGFFNGIFTHSSHDAIRLYGRGFMDVEDKLAYHIGAVHIGAYSFLGAHVTVLPGTRIGRGCVVAAYSLVKGDFPDGAVIAGNPAKVVGSTAKGDAAWLEKHPELKASYYLNAGERP